MRILFSVRNPSYVRHYESVLRMLCARGHDVELAAEDRRFKGWPPSVVALAESCPRIRLSLTPTLDKTPWFELATRLRQARFYLRFLEPMYRGMPGLLARTRAKAPPLAVRLTESALGRTRLARALLVRVIDLLEASTRTAAAYHAYLDQLRPDVVVLTPLVVLKTCQLDLARAAIERGLRNVFAVASWDHLSSKGELNFLPQHVIVWNDVQKREAVELHRVPAERVIVTGSQIFDEWFTRRPSTTRLEFCRRVGLRTDRPVVLYVSSALLEGTPSEVPFVLRWVRHLRQSGHPVLRDCGILIRPHFKRGNEWRTVDLGGLENIACWPPAGAVPDHTTPKSDYFDSLHHASATVGLNTSALIEAAILGRPVYTVLLPEYAESQEGTVHFRYLLEGADALLRASRSLDEHARDLASGLEGRNPDPDRSARFVRVFVRPDPVDVPATTRFVDAIEGIAARPAPPPVSVPAWTVLVRPFLTPFAQAAAERARRITRQRRELKQAQIRAHRNHKAARG